MQPAQLSLLPEQFPPPPQVLLAQLPDSDVAEAIRLAPGAKGEIFVINLSGRGDKDIDIYRENFPELDS